MSSQPTNLKNTVRYSENIFGHTRIQKKCYCFEFWNCCQVCKDYVLLILQDGLFVGGLVASAVHTLHHTYPSLMDYYPRTHHTVACMNDSLKYRK